MLPIRTILHPTDFSDRSAYALHLACALARDHGARLVVLHTVMTPTVVYVEGVIPPEPDVYYREAKEQLANLEVPDPRLTVERRFEEGDPATEIVRVAGEIQASLIVMGTHGRTGVSRLLMGSVAEQVMRQAPCPVLTLKTPFPEAELASAPAAAATGTPVVVM